jgi:hypothetical protein
MGAHSIRFQVQPRLVPAAKAARRLHLTLDEFRAEIAALRLEGFPAPCPVTGHFDLVAIDAWLDRRAGLAAPAPRADADAIIKARLDSIG